MHDEHPTSVAQVSYTQFYIIIYHVYNALVDAKNLKSGPSFELQNEFVVLLN